MLVACLNNTVMHTKSGQFCRGLINDLSAMSDHQHTPQVSFDDS